MCKGRANVAEGNLDSFTEVSEILRTAVAVRRGGSFRPSRRGGSGGGNAL